MKNIRILFLTITIAMLLSPLNVLAEEDTGPTASIDIATFTKYVWRGEELSDDSIVLQPSFTVGYEGFSLNLWANMDTAADDRDPLTKDKSALTETDLTLAYERSVGPLNLGVGYIYYGLDGLDDSEEIYFSLGSDLPLSPTLTIYKEISNLQRYYLNLGLSHSFNLPRNMTLDLSGGLGYYFSTDDSYVEVDDSLNPTTKRYRNFHDGTLSAGLTIPVNKYVTVTPGVYYSFPLSNEAKNMMKSVSFNGDSNFLYGGVTLSISF